MTTAINSIRIFASGFVECKSSFYRALNTTTGSSYIFSVGLNQLVDEIDSGAWGISYLMSMFNYDTESIILAEEPYVFANDSHISLQELCSCSCYMDKSYPLFSSNNSIEEIVAKSIEEHSLQLTAEVVREIFHIDKERFSQPITSTGHEIFRAMAAIGFCSNKQIFCFPWMSRKLFKSYNLHLPHTIQILESLNKIIVFPLGKE